MAGLTVSSGRATAFLPPLFLLTPLPSASLAQIDAPTRRSKKTDPDMTLGHLF